MHATRKGKAFVVLSFAAIFLLVVQYFVNTVSFQKLPPKHHKTKYILYWTEMFRRSDFYFGFGSKLFESCPSSNCFATNDRTLLPIEKYDAILFHGAEYNEAFFGKPENRSPNQVYVYSNQESPINYPNHIKLANFFNWTMTYRLDSDIIRPYGFLREEKTNYVPPSKTNIESRPRKIVWMVSNCHAHSRRQALYEKINKFIPVDVYGNCGNFNCSKKNPENCYNFLEQNYKFYLAFENSVCKGYVTEKLYNILQKNIVPIVYGGANYNEIAPPYSVVDVTKFDSIKDLVDYIKYLDKNVEKYVEYFEWKKSYTVDTSNKLALCTLCEKLNKPIETKVYSDVSEWWDYPNVCLYGNKLPKILFT